MTWPQPNLFRSRLNYAMACGTELAAPLLRWQASRSAPGAVTSPRNWRKTLLIGANHIGDILYRTSSLDALKRGLPECEFDLVAPAPAGEIALGNPALRKIHFFEPPTRKESAEFAQLRAERYDSVICYDNGGYNRALKLAVDLGIPNRAGYVQKGFSGWVTHPIALRHPQPFPAYFRDLVAQLTGQEPTWSLRPQVFPSAEDEHAAAALWQEFGLSQSKPVLACFITSRQPSGVWPEDRFMETLRQVLAEKSTPVSLVLCGAPSDREKLETLRGRLGVSCPILSGQLGLRALVAFLKKCTAVLCTDSGPRHLSNAAGTPVVFVRNLFFSSVEAGLYAGSSEYDFAPPLELLPPEKQAEAFALVSPTKVAATLLKILQSQ